VAGPEWEMDSGAGQAVFEAARWAARFVVLPKN